MEYEHNLIHYLGPSHGLMILIYIMYFMSFIGLAAMRHCNANKFDNIAVQAVHDLRCISRVECLRLIFSHLLLPFEKFGILGFVVGALYWPIAVPLCIIVSLFYCIPTLYLLGRLLIQGRPEFLKMLPVPSSPLRKSSSSYKRSLTEGTTSLESCLLLDNISPELHQPIARKPIRKEHSSCFGKSRQAIHTAGLSFLVGFLCVLFMISVLVLFTEVFGFLIEVCVFTLMGAVVNASSAAKYIMLAFWVIVYSTSCFNAVYERYMSLNSRVFEMIKDKLKDDVENVTLMREERQKNTAFKYFTNDEVKDHKRTEAELEYSSDEDVDVEKRGLSQSNSIVPVDTIEYINDQLHWRLNHLILFVDRKDIPRIPKELFERICEIDAPGCPGPVYKSLLRACRKFLYMIIFLTFVVIVVMAFGDVYKLSTTNQLLVTLAGGFLPFVVRFVLTSKQEELSLNTYSFNGKIHNIIDSFTQTWPVFDLSFDIIRTEGHEPDITGAHPPQGCGPGGGSAPGTSGVQGQTVLPDDQGYATLSQPSNRPGVPAGYHLPRRTEPSQVDLLITIRDDSEDDQDQSRNLRSEPQSGNYGSHGSLNSGHLRPSPDEGMANTTNASILARQIAAVQAAQAAQAAAAQAHHNQAANTLNKQISSSAGTQSNAETPVRRTVSYDATASAGSHGSPAGTGSTSPRPVDLMVDMVRGGVLVRNPMDAVDNNEPPGATALPGNGTIPMWSRTSPYKKLPSKEGESCV